MVWTNNVWLIEWNRRLQFGFVLYTYKKHHPFGPKYFNSPSPNKLFFPCTEIKIIGPNIKENRIYTKAK